MPRVLYTNEDDDVVITDLDHLVGLVEKTASTEVNQAEKSFTIRLGWPEASLIDAMASYSGQTRNLLCASMLEFAANEVLSKMKPKARKEVRVLAGELMTGYWEQHQQEQAAGAGK